MEAVARKKKMSLRLQKRRMAREGARVIASAAKRNEEIPCSNRGIASPRLHVPPNDVCGAAEFPSAAFYRLMAWLSPAYPVGAFSYSSGIEWAVEANDVSSAESLQDWLKTVVVQGSVFCDAVFFVHAHVAVAGAGESALRAVAELAAAFASSKERHLETTAQGRAFLDATQAVWPCAALEQLQKSWNGPLAYPVVVGVAAAGHGIARDTALRAYLQAVAANMISAGVRLIPLGQTDGLRVFAALEATIEQAAARATETPLEEVGGSAFRSDIAGMRHEAQYTRLFRS